MTTQHYLLSNESINPVLRLPLMATALRAELARWIVQGMHLRDFPAAVTHVGYVLAFDEALANASGSQGVESPAAPASPRIDADAVNAALAKAGPRQRLYNEAGQLAGYGFDSTLLAMAAVLREWKRCGGLVREFAFAAAEEANTLVYDVTTRQSMQGLGGCVSPGEYLVQTPA